jgi:small-conductance mechanosensitive channel
MTLSTASLLFAIVSFFVTFTVVRLLARWLKRRRSVRDEKTAAANQSRQVRRARQRAKAPR